MINGRKLWRLLPVTALVLLCACGEKMPTESESLPTPLLSHARAIVPEGAIGSLVRPSFSVVPGPDVVLNFEGFAHYTPITSQFADFGVTFAGSTILNLGQGLNPVFPPHSGIGVIFDQPPWRCDRGQLCHALRN